MQRSERPREPLKRIGPSHPEAVRIRLGRDGADLKEDRFLGGRLLIESSRGVHGPERMVIGALSPDFGGDVLVVGGRGGVVSLAAARIAPQARVEQFHLDAYDHRRALAAAAANGLGNFRAMLGADLERPGRFDWVFLPVKRSSDAMLTGEWIRQAYRSLKPRGKLLAGTENPNDRWLHDQILEVFGAATIHVRNKHGRVYIARRQDAREPRERDYRRRFAARLFGREIDVETRPGVFSHGDLDGGTLALAEVASATIEGKTGVRVADLGCGSGALGIAAALASPGGRAVLVDSSARSVQVARANIARNGAANSALAVLGTDLASLRVGSFDAVLANPPYFSDFRIAELFIRESLRVLAPGGELFLVAKAAERPLEIANVVFGNAEIAARRGYTVIRARRGSS